MRPSVVSAYWTRGLEERLLMRGVSGGHVIGGMTFRRNVVRSPMSYLISCSVWYSGSSVVRSGTTSTQVAIVTGCWKVIFGSVVNLKHWGLTTMLVSSGPAGFLHVSPL